MRVFMAGAITTGPSKARWPSRAARRRGRRPSARSCSPRRGRPASGRRGGPAPGGRSPARSSAPNRSVPTGRPDRAAKVAGPTKRRAARVITTVTPWPRALEDAHDVDRLVGGDPPGHPAAAPQPPCASAGDLGDGAANSSAAASTSSLTMTWSNSSIASSSTRLVARRAAISPSVSVAAPLEAPAELAERRRHDEDRRRLGDGRAARPAPPPARSRRRATARRRGCGRSRSAASRSGCPRTSRARGSRPRRPAARILGRAQEVVVAAVDLARAARGGWWPRRRPRDSGSGEGRARSACPSPRPTVPRR